MGGLAVNIISGFGLNLLGELQGGYRPINWLLRGPETTSLTIYTNAVSSSRLDFGDGNSTPNPNSTGNVQTMSTTYIFDAVMRLDHEQELEVTRHPIQYAASLTDHTYLIPPRVVLEVGMSDSMVSYTAGQWSGASSRSVAAYEVLEQAQEARSLCQLTTRIRTYKNMIIKALRVPDDVRTRRALRMTVVMEQLLLAVTQTGNAPSSRPNSSSGTSVGPVFSVSVPPSIPTLGLGK